MEVCKAADRDSQKETLRECVQELESGLRMGLKV